MHQEPSFPKVTLHEPNGSDVPFQVGIAHVGWQNAPSKCIKWAVSLMYNCPLYGKLPLS